MLSGLLSFFGALAYAELGAMLRLPQMQGIITTSSPSLRQFVAVDEPGILAYLLKPLEMASVVALIDQAIAP